MPPVPSAQVSTYLKRLTARRVADRYSVGVRTLYRWIAKKVIPPPDEIILTRRYWFESTLDEADRQRTIAAGIRAERKAAAASASPTTD